MWLVWFCRQYIHFIFLNYININNFIYFICILGLAPRYKTSTRLTLICVFSIRRLFFSNSLNGFFILIFIKSVGRRSIARWVRPTLEEIRKRKKRAGPQPIPMRNSFLEWNHNSELYAFNARLSEKFDSDLLLQAFTFRSYVAQEEEKQKAVGIADPKLDIQSNTDMVEDGQRQTDTIIKAYLCQALPRVPEECI